MPTDSFLKPFTVNKKSFKRLEKVMKKDIEKVYYGNLVNLSGLYSKMPIECHKQRNAIVDIYWDKSGDFAINHNKLGMLYDDDIITFVSENKNDVKIWTEGVLAAMTIMKRWCI